MSTASVPAHIQRQVSALLASGQIEGAMKLLALFQASETKPVATIKKMVATGRPVVVDRTMAGVKTDKRVMPKKQAPVSLVAEVKAEALKPRVPFSDGLGAARMVIGQYLKEEDERRGRDPFRWDPPPGTWDGLKLRPEPAVHLYSWLDLSDRDEFFRVIFRDMLMGDTRLNNNGRKALRDELSWTPFARRVPAPHLMVDFTTEPVWTPDNHQQTPRFQEVIAEMVANGADLKLDHDRIRTKLQGVVRAQYLESIAGRKYSPMTFDQLWAYAHKRQIQRLGLVDSKPKVKGERWFVRSHLPEGFFRLGVRQQAALAKLSDIPMSETQLLGDTKRVTPKVLDSLLSKELVVLAKGPQSQRKLDKLAKRAAVRLAMFGPEGKPKAKARERKEESLPGVPSDTKHSDVLKSMGLWVDLDSRKLANQFVRVVHGGARKASQ